MENPAAIPYRIELYKKQDKTNDMKKLFCPGKGSINLSIVTLFAAALLLSSCNGCSKHGSCPAYTYKAKKEAAGTTARALTPALDEG